MLRGDPFTRLPGNSYVDFGWGAWVYSGEYPFLELKKKLKKEVLHKQDDPFPRCISFHQSSRKNRDYR